MSIVDKTDVVKYRCTCGQLESITHLYFCRHCFKLRCGFCVSHEIDSRYCVDTSESFPAAEAWLKNNYSPNSYLCPICQSTVAPRTTHVPKGENSEESSKVYYVKCYFCQWNSRDASLPDLNSTSDMGSMLHEDDQATINRINELSEYYRDLCLHDRLLKEKKGTHRPYVHISGIHSSVARKYAGLPPVQKVPPKPKINPAEASEIENDLPDDIFSETPDLTRITTLQQRFNMPSVQPIDVMQLKLCKKLLFVKISRRCRVCDHNVTKPEYSPNAAKFKIQHFAYLFVPHIQVKSCDFTPPNAVLRLFLVNPVQQHATTIRFLPLDFYQDPSDYPVRIKPLKLNLNATLTFPENTIPLPARDDAAEYDDTPVNLDFSDDPEVVTWRKGNKMIVNLPIKLEEKLKDDENVTVGFTLEHVYTNTVTQQDSKQFIKIKHLFQVILNLGSK